MPIYEYHCEQCGDFEEMQRITDPPLTRCPRCNRKVQRLISQTSFQLKGTGWYVTDYGRGGGGGRKESSTDGGSASGESKTESKSDSKSESKSAASSSSEKPAASSAKTGS
ncbi:MAG TPA: zinc ribbon domain-containing protein [Candidatus Nitrosopolaris sp.]|nr:zinc ribbon domain-containing protein [Candidatus Nitrosopolaris sp.]